MLDLGRDVGERDQHEPAEMEEGVRDLEPILGDDLVRVEEDVDVEWPGDGRLRRGAGHGPPGLTLDRLGEPQEPVRRQIRLDLDRAVQMPGLSRRTDLRPRRRLVHLRAGDDANRHLRAELGQRRLEVPAAVAQVRAQREEHSRHAYRLRVIRTPGTAGTPSIGAVTLRTVTVTSRAGYSRSSVSQRRPASRSIRWTRSPVPVATTRCTTWP